MNMHIKPEGPAHAVWAPSMGHRWAKEGGCTAAPPAIAMLPEQEEGEEAQEGTEAHEEIERCLGHLNGRVADPQEFGAITVDRDHPAAYGLALMFSYLRGLPAGRIWIEQRVTLTPKIWGRCDVAHWHAESFTLTIVDYKNGYVGVDAEENEQLQIYAAASIYTHNLPVKHVRLVVVQPNDFRPVPRVKQHVMTAAALFQFAERVAKIPDGPLEFVAGEHCKYCPLFGRCKASADVLLKIGAAMAYAPDEVPADQWALFKACEKPVSDWFKNGDKAQLKKALTGATIAGMKVVRVATHRAWKDEAAARKFVLDLKGFEALSPPTPAQAEKLGLDIEALCHRPEGGPALAFESDKRPTFERKSVEQMFKGVAP